MDNEKTGRLIRSLRKEMGLTQKQLADMMNISDKAVSKWERGLGCPDVSLLTELADIFGVGTDVLLSGEQKINEKSGGNMRNTVFYRCPVCGETAASSKKFELSCCGRKMSPLAISEADDAHKITAEPVEDELYITLDHEMTKAHYLTFAAYVSADTMTYIKLYPEQDPAFRIKARGSGFLYIGCSEHGLFRYRLK